MEKSIAEVKRIATKPKFLEPQQFSPALRECSYCGNSHAPRRCPAYGKQCSNCGKPNHFARVCKSRLKSGRPQLQEVMEAPFTSRNEDEDPGSHFFLGECSNNYVFNNDWKAAIILNNDISVIFKIDTGADVCIIDHKTFTSFKEKPLLMQSGKKLITPAGELKYIGVINCGLKFKQRLICEDIYILCLLMSLQIIY